MRSEAANQYLASKGYPELELVKMEGVWYVLGDRPEHLPQFNGQAERCLHCCQLSQLTTATLDAKLSELTKET